MRRSGRAGRGFAAAAGLLIAAAPAAAQVGSALVAAPWAPGQRFGGESYVIGTATETLDDGFGPGDDLGLVRSVSFGRVRFEPDNPGGASAGFLADYLALDTDDPRLPDRLVNTAVAAGGTLGQLGEWQTGFTVGGGFAGDEPYADADGWYGLGSLFFRRRLPETPTFLTILIDFDGSRAFLPDLPLPAVQYTVRESATLTYSLGLPFSSIRWQPADRWLIEGRFLIPTAGSLDVTYSFGERWSAYGAYEASTRGFHLEGDDEHRRLFFEQSRLEAGVRHAWTDELRLYAAAGYAFQQEFNRGFDSRDVRRVRDVEDSAYFRVGVTAGF